MIVKFVDPITGEGLDGIKQYDPTKMPSDFSKIPEKSGVYIYGLRLDIIEEGETKKKFVPLYIGTALNLKVRLAQHYNEEKAGGKSLKELWDFSSSSFSITDIKKRYKEMGIYDSYPRIEKHEMWKMITLEYLIWFQNLCFYGKKLSSQDFPCKDSNHIDTIDKYFKQTIARNPSLKSDLNVIGTKIIDTKAKFNNGYYFVYATLEDDIQNLEGHPLQSSFPNYLKEYRLGNKRLDGQNFANAIELATKKSLNKIGIHTTAEANGKLYDMTIDLSNLKENLINLNNYDFNIEIHIP